MAHLRKPLTVALGLNTALLAVEAIGCIGANSLSLGMDAVHNLSDEMALVFLVLAYTLRAGLSGRFLRAANLFSSVGLLTVSGLMLWQAIVRLIHPPVVLGFIPIVAGLIAALGNWGVARALRGPSREDTAIRLAYVHNMGDVLVSLAPVGAGICTILSGSSRFDAFVAILIAGVMIATTLQAILSSQEELLWPKNVACSHPPGPVQVGSSN